MSDLFEVIYVYCTDFTIFLANILGVSYEDSNALLFCVLWPIITLFLVLLLLVQLLFKRK
jgi:hypothetical protein